MRTRERPGSASAFWAWFVSHERSLRVEPPPEDAMAALLAELLRYRRDLGFEVCVIGPGLPELIITAYGEAELFSDVDRLVWAAPKDLAGRVFALKPGLGFDFVHARDGHDYDPQSMWFDPLALRGDARVLGIRAYVEQLRPEGEAECLEAVRVILLTALGEREMASAIRRLEVAPLPDDFERDEALRLDQLPAYIAWDRRRHGTTSGGATTTEGR